MGRPAYQGPYNPPIDVLKKQKFPNLTGYTYPHKYDIGNFVVVKDFVEYGRTDVQIVSRIGLAPGERLPRYVAYHHGSRITNTICEEQIIGLLKGPTGSDPYEEDILKQDLPLHTKDSQAVKHDPVNHPSHYKSHPSGLEDLKKAQWHLNREIARLEKDKT